MVSTQDVSFGTMWTRLVGASARWEPGGDDVPALAINDLPLMFGAGLVAVWVAEEGPVLVCRPKEGLQALKHLPPGTPIEELRRALREGGAVVREDFAPRRDSTT